jgi:ABC-type multidrug transport system fused ATPase/permease subunit
LSVFNEKFYNSVNGRHRLTTVRQCDQIYLLEKGELKARGTFDELVSQNNTFQKMTGTV